MSVESKSVNPVGIASLVLGIVACIFCWIPLLGLLVVPVAIIGALLGVIGLIIAAVNRKSGFAFPIGGLIVSLVAGFLAVAVTGSIAKSFVKARQTNQELVSTNPTATNQDNAPIDWSKSATVKQGDAKVSITRISIPRSASPIEITLVVENIGTTKKIDFSGWSGMRFDIGGNTVRLTDNYQNNYKRVIAAGMEGITGTASGDSIYPHQSITETIRFESPIEQVQWLHLELPANDFGGSGMLRFEIPGERIQQVRQAAERYDSFIRNDGYLTNATYAALAQKRKALTDYYENLRRQSQTPAQKAALAKMWNETIVDQYNRLNSALDDARVEAINLEKAKVTDAETSFRNQ